MAEKILFVDDDELLLDGIRRQLRKRYPLDTALGPEEGLAAIGSKGPFAVVVSDFRMPGMDGVTFLAKVREMSPDTVRIMLTGQADLDASIAAVNQGHVFRFLTKPCPPDVLEANLAAAFEQYRLITAERELLRGTLRGSVRVMTEILALTSPLAFGRTHRIKRLTGSLARELGLPDVWRHETAAMLSQIGCVAVPEDILTRVFGGRASGKDDLTTFGMHPGIAKDLLSFIPRMGDVAQAVFYQEKHFDGSGTPIDDVKGEDIPLGGRILKVALDFDLLAEQGKPPGEALTLMRGRQGVYDPKIIAALASHITHLLGYKLVDVPPAELREGMILDEDILDADKGILLMSKGQEVSALLRLRLKTLASNNFHLPKTVRAKILTKNEP